MLLRYSTARGHNPAVTTTSSVTYCRAVPLISSGGQGAAYAMTQPPLLLLLLLLCTANCGPTATDTQAVCA
jgi:hypothetical protein